MFNYQPDWTTDDLEPEAPQALREALFWHEICSRADMSAAMKEDFESWLMADPGNARVYGEIDAIWQSARGLPQFGQLMKQRSRARMTRRMFVAGGAAATGLLASRIWLAGHPFADIRTAKGELRHHRLEDGSRLEIAGRTAMSYDFSAGRRAITLHHGEAWFDMKAAGEKTGSGRSFEVAAGAARIRGDAAHFTLETSSGSSFLTVAERQATLVLGRREFRVSAGQQLAFDQSDARLSQADLDSALAWREGRLVYVSQPVSRIIAGINRWSEDRIVILGSALSRRSATLIMDIGHVGQALETLQQAVPMRVVEAPGRMIFIS